MTTRIGFEFEQQRRYSIIHRYVKENLSSGATQNDRDIVPTSTLDSQHDEDDTEADRKLLCPIEWPPKKMDDYSIFRFHDFEGGASLADTVAKELFACEVHC